MKKVKNGKMDQKQIEKLAGKLRGHRYGHATPTIGIASQYAPTGIGKKQIEKNWDKITAEIARQNEISSARKKIAYRAPVQAARIATLARQIAKGVAAGTILYRGRRSWLECNYSVTYEQPYSASYHRRYGDTEIRHYYTAICTLSGSGVDKQKIEWADGRAGNRIKNKIAKMSEKSKKILLKNLKKYHAKKSVEISHGITLDTVDDCLRYGIYDYHVNSEEVIDLLSGDISILSLTREAWKKRKNEWINKKIIENVKSGLTDCEVDFLDSVSAGNCPRGTENFATTFAGQPTVLASEILAVRDDSYTRRAVCFAVNNPRV